MYGACIVIAKGIIDNQTSVRTFFFKENHKTPFFRETTETALQQSPTKYCLILKAKFYL